MESTIQYIKDLPLLFTKNKSVLINALMFTIITCISNYSEIKEKIMPKQDIVSKYVDNTFQVESTLDLMKSTYHADNVSIAILHNGVVGIHNKDFHLMKYSVLFSVGKDANVNKVMYNDQPVSLWLNHFRSMLKSGYFVIEDLSKSKDVLVRRIGKDTGVKTQIYLPLFKDGCISGFAIVSYKKKRVIEKESINDMTRSLDEIEVLL